MEKGRYISDLQPGDFFKNCLFAVSHQEKLSDRNGNAYISMRLSDSTGHRRAKQFQTTDRDWETISVMGFLRATGEVQSEGNYRGELVIKASQALGQVADLEPFLPPLPDNHRLQQERFQEMVTSILEPNLRQLARAIFDPEQPFWNDFCGAVAAKSLHHGYRGGLLDHTLEVAQLCDHTAQVVPSLRRDFLVTCALLHDIGKLEEMSHGIGAGEYTAAGSLVGHIVLGAHRVANVADTIEGFPVGLKHAVMHLILSHHGRPEWGAAREPACAEAHVLSLNDMLSARLYQCSEAVAGATAGQLTARSWGVEGGFVYVGDMGLSAVE